MNTGRVRLEHLTKTVELKTLLKNCIEQHLAYKANTVPHVT